MAISGEVVFASAEEVTSYVEREIEQVIPAGWWFRRDVYGTVATVTSYDVSSRGSRDTLVWRIFPPGVRPDERQTTRDFILVVSADFETFTIYCGNSDEGPLGLHHVLMNARIMERMALRFFPLSAAIKHAIEHCEPNQWGRT